MTQEEKRGLFLLNRLLQIILNPFIVRQEKSCLTFWISLPKIYDFLNLGQINTVSVPRVYLVILFACLIACKNDPHQEPFIPVPGLEKAESFFNKNNDSAYYYFNKIASSSNDSLKIATAYCYMAIIQNYNGDHFGAQESLLASLSFLDEHKEASRYCLVADYHELGNNSLNLKNYDAAIEYYNKALNYMTDSNAKIIALNSKAIAFQKKGNYDQAITIYSSIVDGSRTNIREYARVLSNYARTKWLRNSKYQAATDMLQALEIRRNLNDSRGLNASYAHLSDYYLQTKPDSGLFYAVKMYETARTISNPDDEIEALSKLIPLSPHHTIKAYFTRYQYLIDSIQTARNAARNQFALIRYEAEKNRSDNLRLQKDNIHKEIQLIKQRYIFGITLLFTTSFLIFSFLYYRKRKKQIEVTSQKAIQENQLKTSQKVHDVVANGLYRLMNNIEHEKVIDKDSLLDKIEVLYEQSREISYELPTVTLQRFQDKISELLKSFASIETKVLIIGNNEITWSSINPKNQIEIEKILLELMVNMKKHSRAQKVLVKFERKTEHLHIIYNDDGIGIPANYKFGNGLTNTENRINKLGGQIIFDRNANKGLTIRIEFPTSRLL